MLLRIGVISLVSLLLSGLFTYYYYDAIVKDQMLQIDKKQLEQTARQLQYMSDNIAMFASTLIISEPVQRFFLEYKSADTFKQFQMQSETFNFLKDHQGLRQEVESFALVFPDGDAYWDPAPNDAYFRNHMNQPWYERFARSNRYAGFTEPHEMFLNGNATTEQKTISYIVNVRHVEFGGRVIGQLILHLNYSSFAQLLDFGGEHFDGYWWIGGDNADLVLYSPGGSAAGAQDAPWSAELARDETGNGDPGEGLGRPAPLPRLLEAGDRPVAAGNGYFQAERLAGYDWQLVAYTSNETLMERSRFILYLLIVFSLTSAAVILSLMMPAVFRMTRAILQLYQAMVSVSSGNLQTSVSIRTGDELERLGNGFNRMTQQLQVHLDESIRYEQEKKEMEWELLMSQINPHFVYNTLNAVIYMAERAGHKSISAMVGALIRILQNSIQPENGAKLVPLAEEIQVLKDYISIQSYRYEGMFDVAWDVSEAALRCLLPRKTLQPFVENAIFHGICPKDEYGTIWLSAAVSPEGRLVVRVRDDGVGIDPARLADIWTARAKAARPSGVRNIGLPNTKRRIEHFFGDRGKVRIDSEPSRGTTVTIELPAIAADAAAHDRDAS